MNATSDQEKVVELFTDHLYLVKYKAHCFKNKFISSDELQGIGRIGLWKASLTFDESKGKFTTYAYKAIENEINMVLRGEKTKKRNCTRLISLEQNVKRDSNKINYHDIVGQISIEYGKLDDKSEVIYLLNQYKNRFNHKKRKMLCLELTIKNIFEQISQLDLVDIYGIEQSHISRMIKECLCDLRSIIEDNKECIAQ